MSRHLSTPSFVAGLMLGILATGVWFASDTDSLDSFLSLQTADTTSSANKTPVPESGALSVAASQPAGTTVAVESVTVSPPGVWVAVREINGADLGNVLGAVRVNGPRTEVTIPLLRATEPGLPYAVELYRDDGNGEFDLSNDSVYVDFATGAPAIAYFSTTN